MCKYGLRAKSDPASFLYTFDDYLNYILDIKQITKRNLFSILGQMSCSNGVFLSFPNSQCKLVCHMLHQRVESPNLTWETPLNELEVQSLNMAAKTFYILSNLKIKRNNLFFGPNVTYILIGSSDASERLHSCTIHLISCRISECGKILQQKQMLLYSKAFSNPVQNKSIPICELSGMLRNLQKTCQIYTYLKRLGFSIPNTQILLLSDSQSAIIQVRNLPSNHSSRTAHIISKFQLLMTDHELDPYKNIFMFNQKLEPFSPDFLTKKPSSFSDESIKLIESKIRNPTWMSRKPSSWTHLSRHKNLPQILSVELLKDLELCPHSDKKLTSLLTKNLNITDNFNLEMESKLNTNNLDLPLENNLTKTATHNVATESILSAMNIKINSTISQEQNNNNKKINSQFTDTTDTTSIKTEIGLLLDRKNYYGIYNNKSVVTILGICNWFYYKLKTTLTLPQNERIAFKINRKKTYDNLLVGKSPYCGKILCGSNGIICSKTMQRHAKIQLSYTLCEQQYDLLNRSIKCTLTNFAHIFESQHTITSCANDMHINDTHDHILEDKNNIKTIYISNYESINPQNLKHKRNPDIKDVYTGILNQLTNLSYFQYNEHTQRLLTKLVLYQLSGIFGLQIKEKISNTFFNTEIYHGNYNNLKWNYIIGREQEAILSCGTKIQLGTPIIKIIAENNAFAKNIFTTLHANAVHSYKNMKNYVDQEICQLIKIGISFQYNRKFFSENQRNCQQCKLTKAKSGSHLFNMKSLKSRPSNIYGTIALNKDPSSISCLDLGPPIKILCHTGTCNFQAYPLIILTHLNQVYIQLLEDYSAETLMTALLKHSYENGSFKYITADEGGQIHPLFNTIPRLNQISENENLPPFWKNLLLKQFNKELENKCGSILIENIGSKRHHKISRLESLMGKLKNFLRQEKLWKKSTSQTFSELDLTLAKFASIINSRPIAIINGDIYCADDLKKINNG